MRLLLFHLPVQNVVSMDVLKGIHHLRELGEHFELRQWVDLLLQVALQRTVTVETNEAMEQ